jgi:hypothetical protein
MFDNGSPHAPPQRPDPPPHRPHPPASCAGPQVQNYAQEKPLLDLRTYFNGTLDAWGVFTDRSGQVVKRFTVVMDCSWTGDEGVLDEAFVYSDGTTQRRIWKLKAGPNGSYTGRADDVVGEATGQVSGNACRWTVGFGTSTLTTGCT